MAKPTILSSSKNACGGAVGSVAIVSLPAFTSPPGARTAQSAADARPGAISEKNDRTTDASCTNPSFETRPSGVPPGVVPRRQTVTAAPGRVNRTRAGAPQASMAVCRRGKLPKGPPGVAVAARHDPFLVALTL